MVAMSVVLHNYMEDWRSFSLNRKHPDSRSYSICCDNSCAISHGLLNQVTVRRETFTGMDIEDGDSAYAV